MRRISELIAIAAIAALMLGGSAWASAQVQADAVLPMRSDSTGSSNFNGHPTQGLLLPFFCHW